MIKKFEQMENKPSLKMTSEMAHFIDYGDFENFVNEIYGASDYSFAATQESANDVSYVFKPDGKIDKWEKDDAKEIRSGNIGSFENNTLFNCLVADGYLEPGTYVVKVYW